MEGGDRLHPPRYREWTAPLLTVELWDVNKESPPGMPRPIAKHDKGLLPVAWSQGEGWGVGSITRNDQAAKKSLCLVCGLPVKTGFVVIALEHREAYKRRYYRDDLSKTEVTDTGPLHPRCAKMTVAHCDTIKERLKLGEALMCPYTLKKRKRK